MDTCQISRPTQVLFEIFLFALLPFAALEVAQNAGRGFVPHPWAALVVLIGFTSFLYAKVAVIRRQNWINWGTRWMTEDQANAYRVGYWLMVVGLLATFLPWTV